MDKIIINENEETKQLNITVPANIAKSWADFIQHAPRKSAVTGAALQHFMNDVTNGSIEVYSQIIVPNKNNDDKSNT